MNMARRLLPRFFAEAAAVLIILGTMNSTRAENAATPGRVGVCIYGGTSSGVMAAVEAKKMGCSVLPISPTTHLAA